MFSKTKKSHQRTNGKIHKPDIKTAKRRGNQRDRSPESINPLSGTDIGESPPKSSSTPSPIGTDQNSLWGFKCM